MPLHSADTFAEELFQRALDRFGKERAEALLPQLRQMAAELEVLHAYNLDFVDES